CTTDPPLSNSKTYCKLGISVIRAPTSSSNYSLYESNIVIGTHFRRDNLACLFVHNLDNTDLNEISIKIDNIPRLLGVKWKNTVSRFFRKEPSKKLTHDKALHLTLDKCVKRGNHGDYELEYPLLIYITNDCDYHG
ncbi:1996_t:CDS:2, partial [Racocetra fulgida]